MSANFYSFDYLRQCIYIVNNLEGHIIRHCCISPHKANSVLLHARSAGMPGGIGCRWGSLGQSTSPSPASHPLQTRKLVHTNQPHLARAELNFPSSSSAHHRGAFPRSALAGAHLGPLQHLYPTGRGRLGTFSFQNKCISGKFPF